MADITIVCRSCSKEFLHTDRDQEFYRERGYTNEPKDCRDCRYAKKQERYNSRKPREEDSSNE